MIHEMLLILDYGSQYTQLIARRARELGVRAEIRSFAIGRDELAQLNPKAIILSGGPASVTDASAPALNSAVLAAKAPILGICYGMQLLSHALGGSVRQDTFREYGLANLVIKEPGSLLSGIPRESAVWASHGDVVERLPDGFRVLGVTGSGALAAAEDTKRKIFLVQFHPEVAQTSHGLRLLKNFLFPVSGFRGDWTMKTVAQELVQKVQQQVRGGRVICALSGGVDSSVVAAILHKAIPGQVLAVLVDHGLLRLQEAQQVTEALEDVIGKDLVVVDAKDRFFHALAGIGDPEEKRKIIGRLFIDVFDETAKKWGGADFLAQGTLYPDVIESSPGGGPSATIKSHHNVGGLPETMKMRLVEPLRELFKDEVRAVGKALGLPDRIIGRHPFPGPGLAIRVLGPVTPEAVQTLARADDIFLAELRSAGLYDMVWQAFATLLPVRTVGVMGDQRTYDQVIALRAVTSTDGMTADWARLPQDFLARVSARIINEVPGINRVVYDISSKPPATIEWE